MKKDSAHSPLKQLFELTLGTDKVGTLSQCERFIEDGGSVFDLVNMGHQGLMQTFGLHTRDAKVVLDKANSLMVHTARQFREWQLISHVPGKRLHCTGVRGLVDKPTYQELFHPSWDNNTTVGSINANDSPAAYYVELFEKALALEKDKAGVIKIDDRRSDLAQLIIGPVSTFKILPTVVLVNEVLESIIKKYIDSPAHRDEDDNKYQIDDRLLETRFPLTSMPFEWYQKQWSHVLEQNKLSLGDVVRTADRLYPYFKEKGIHGGASDDAFRQASGLGPVQHKLLTETSYFAPVVSAGTVVAPIDPRTGLTEDAFEKAADFFKDNFGSNYEALEGVAHFCAHASINNDGLASLLSIEHCAPTVSNNAPSAPEEITPADFGSVFINSGESNTVGVSAPKETQTRKLTMASKYKFDRMNRMLRLARWLGLPFDQCDRLVVAAIRAELRGNIRSYRRAQESPLWMTANTLRAVGLFQEFRQHYKCSAEDFAALIDDLAIYGLGEQASQFDRIFNAQSLFETPLVLDDGFFSIVPYTVEDQRTIDQICSGLGINQETWRYLARVVADSHGAESGRTQLRRSLPIISAFYRLVKLASLFRITSIEMAALLETLSPKGNDLLRELLGVPHVAVYKTFDKADVLSVLHAAHSCVQWCLDNDLTVQWLVQHVAPVVVPLVATEEDIALLHELRKRLEPTRLLEASFMAAGLPSPNAPSWMSLLDELVDPDGLLSNAPDGMGYEEYARAEVEAAVQQSGISVVEVVRVAAVILALLLQAKAAQSAVVQESLSVYLGAAQDLVLPILKWVDSGGVYLLLKETMRVLKLASSTTEKIKIGDEILKLLAHLVRRTAVVQKLTLSSAMLVTITNEEQWKWFGFQQIKELTLHSFYFLTIYCRAVIHTEAPAENLLSYLRLVNELPPVLTNEDMRLIRDSAAGKLAEAVQWGIREVLECAIHLNPQRPLIHNMVDLDLLIRARGLAARSGLSAAAIFALGKLTPESNVASCRQAAERALECLSESAIQASAQTFGEVGQSLTGSFTLSHEVLIARKPNQIAQIEITLRDFTDKPYSNITVTWECEQAGLQVLESRTDHLGRATTRFKAGDQMGVVYINARYGLGEVMTAPRILIDCEEETLTFASSLSTPPTEYRVPKLAGEHGVVELQVGLVDVPENRGIDREVTWETTVGRADPVKSLTDQNGIARTMIRSMNPAEDVSVRARYEGRPDAIFSKISFVDRPRISEFKAVSQAVAGEPLELHCFLVGLDGLAAHDVEVEFYEGNSGAITEKSDIDGIAKFQVDAPTAGKLILRTSVTSGDKLLTIDVAKAAVMYGKSLDNLFPVAGSNTPTFLWVEIREEASNEARPIGQYPIYWSVQSVTADGGKTAIASLEVVYRTNENGRSTYPFSVLEAGHYEVTASKRGLAPATQTFKLEVIEAIEWVYRLVDLSPFPALVDEPPSTVDLMFIRGHNYRLEIDLPQGVDLKGARAMLAWSGAYSAKALGMSFNPAIAQYVVIDSEKLVFTIDCADVRNGTFDLTLFCNSLDQTLVMRGRLTVPLPEVLRPLANAEVELTPLISGQADRSATIYVYEDKTAEPLAWTSADRNGQWYVSITEPLSEGTHTLRIKQTTVDGTENWAPDVQINVKANFIAPPEIQSPEKDAQVESRPWFEGIGFPEAQIRVVKDSDPNTVYAKGTVLKDGHWRIRPETPLPVGKYELAAQLQSGELKSDFGSRKYPIEVVAPTRPE